MQLSAVALTLLLGLQLTYPLLYVLLLQANTGVNASVTVVHNSNMRHTAYQESYKQQQRCW
jgi:hypothetical protein